MDRKWAIIGIVLTLAAWGCWQAMEGVADNSAEETALFIGGYLLIPFALAALFIAFRKSQS